MRNPYCPCILESHIIAESVVHDGDIDVQFDTYVLTNTILVVENASQFASNRMFRAEHRAFPPDVV